MTGTKYPPKNGCPHRKMQGMLTADIEVCQRCRVVQVGDGPEWGEKRGYWFSSLAEAREYAKTVTQKTQ